jgi:putative PIN family toxin of toxin-antitoxin system
LNKANNLTLLGNGELLTGNREKKFSVFKKYFCKYGMLPQKFDKYLPLIERQELLATFAESSLFINPTEEINECRDPKDNKYLELAVAGQAECIVTGDNDLLVLHPFRGIDILTVQDFLARDVNET